MSISNSPNHEKSRIPIIGSSKSTTLISAAKKYMAHLHVSKLGLSTTTYNLLKFLHESIQGSSCEKLISKKPDIYSSFKLSLPIQYLPQVMESSFWHGEVTVIRIFLKHRQVDSPIRKSPSWIIKTTKVVNPSSSN